MPIRKKVIHYCARCQKQMDYTEKTMVYIYDVAEYRSHEYRPQKRIALNLCRDCSLKLEEHLTKFCNGGENSGTEK